MRIGALGASQDPRRPPSADRGQGLLQGRRRGLRTRPWGQALADSDSPLIIGSWLRHTGEWTVFQECQNGCPLTTQGTDARAPRGGYWLKVCSGFSSSSLRGPQSRLWAATLSGYTGGQGDLQGATCGLPRVRQQAHAHTHAHMHTMHTRTCTRIHAHTPHAHTQCTSIRAVTQE